MAEPRIEAGHVVADPSRDLAKIAVIERHHGTGRVGLGLVRGFGLRSGAFASTVAHDAHNLVVVGVDDGDMALCAARAQALGGGLVVARGGEVVGELALPIAGLLSDAPLEEVAEGLEHLQDLLVEQGVTIGAPFMTLSFLALSVIPSLKITDRGLVDVDAFQLVPLELDEQGGVRGALRRALRTLAVGRRARVAAARLQRHRRAGRRAAGGDVRGDAGGAARADPRAPGSRREGRRRSPGTRATSRPRSALAPADYDRFASTNAAYREKFGIPFVVCVREHTKASILANADARLGNSVEQEIETALGEIAKIGRLRLEDAL